MIKPPWKPIAYASTLHKQWVYAPGLDGLSSIQCVCEWHPDAGWCIGELREPTHYMTMDEAMECSKPQPSNVMNIEPPDA